MDAATEGDHGQDDADPSDHLHGSRLARLPRPGQAPQSGIVLAAVGGGVLEVSSTTVLRLDAVSKRFGTVAAVDSASLEIARGEIFTLLSGGQMQRLALCRALVYEPDLLLLDEPFSNLDAKLREQMRVELKLLQRRLGITVLFVTHDQIEALSLSDRIAVMQRGRVEQVGAPRELY